LIAFHALSNFVHAEIRTQGTATWALHILLLFFHCTIHTESNQPRNCDTSCFWLKNSDFGGLADIIIFWKRILLWKKQNLKKKISTYFLTIYRSFYLYKVIHLKRLVRLSPKVLNPQAVWLRVSQEEVKKIATKRPGISSEWMFVMFFVSSSTCEPSATRFGGLYGLYVSAISHIQHFPTLFLSTNWDTMNFQTNNRSVNRFSFNRIFSLVEWRFNKP